MSRVALIAWLTACAVSIWFAFHIKYKVQELETELGIARAAIAKDREAIRVLEAEWSYLNQPSRLADLAKRHLDLHPMESKQIVQLGALPQREMEAPDRQTSLEDIIEQILRDDQGTGSLDNRKDSETRTNSNIVPARSTQ